eukprot:132052_1
MAKILETYVLILLSLVMLMFFMLHRDSQQREKYIDDDNIILTNRELNEYEYKYEPEQDQDEPNHHHHHHIHVASDIDDLTDDMELQHKDIPLIKDKPWGAKYDTPRVVCLVPTLWPKKKFVMEAIAQTWGARCDKLFFVIDDEVAAPDTLYNARILKLKFDHKQSTKHRNSWEKVW